MSDYNVEQRQEKNYKTLLAKGVRLFLSQYKGFPYELRAVLDFLFKNIVTHNWLLGFGYQMVIEEQSGEFLEKAVYAKYGITRDFKGTLLTDEQLRKVAKIASVAQSNRYASTQDFIQSIHLLLGDDIIVYEFPWKKVYIFANNFDNFTFDVCETYGLIPKKIGYINMWIFCGDTTTNYFFLKHCKSNAPRGFSGFVSKANGTISLPWIPLDKMRML